MSEHTKDFEALFLPLGLDDLRLANCGCCTYQNSDTQNVYLGYVTGIDAKENEIAHLKQTQSELVQAIKKVTPIFHYMGWIAMCWNDHNFDEKEVYKKVKQAFEAAGFKRSDGVQQINDFVERLEALAKVKGE